MLSLILAFVLQTAPAKPLPAPLQSNGQAVSRSGVQILGEVAKPGRYLVNFHTIPELIEAAGGLTGKAKRDAIVLRRSGTSMPFDYDDREGKGKGLHVWSNGVILFPGDTIIVPAVSAPVRKPIAFVLQTAPAPAAPTVAISGAVPKPGTYALSPQNTTIVQLIAAAGGITHGWNHGAVVVRRQGESGVEVIEFDLAERLRNQTWDLYRIRPEARTALPLKPGDIVIVPTR